MHEPDKLYTLAMEKWITSVKEANLTSDAIYFDGDEKLRPFANVRLLFIFFYITRYLSWKQMLQLLAECSPQIELTE